MMSHADLINLFGMNRIRETDQAELYIEIERINELAECVSVFRKNKFPVYIIGSGSWPHLPEKQIKGLLIKNNCRKFSVFAMSGMINKNELSPAQAKIKKTLVYAESGTMVNQLVRYTIDEGLSGLEYHLGLPGSVGGALFTNARFLPKNIYFCDTVEKITVLNNHNEIEERIPEYYATKSHEFGPASDVILSVMFKLHPEDKQTLWSRGNEALEYRNNKKPEFD